MVDKPVLDVTWSHFIFWFFETFCGHAPKNKLRGSTNFIIFGLTDQKLWVFENLRRSLNRVGMFWSQPTRVDYISPKRWAARIRRFEKSPLRVSSLVFWTLPLHLGGWNLPFLIELGDFTFFQKTFLPKLEYTRTFLSTIGIFVYWKSEFTKNSSRIASVMEIFCTLLQYKVHLSMFHSSPTSKIWYTST
jgi:hypothetical protein